MKIRKEERLPNALHAGDQIEISTSYQLVIDGSQSWVTYKVSAAVQEGEETQDAHDRVIGTVTGGIKKATSASVKTAREMSE